MKTSTGQKSRTGMEAGFRQIGAAAMAVIALTALPASAADVTWDNGGGAGNVKWSNNANWSTVEPTSADTAIFGIKGTLSDPKTDKTGVGAANVLGVDFTGTGGWTISATNLASHTLTVQAGGIDQSGSGLNTVAANVILGTSGTWTVASGTLAVSSVISGSAANGLTKNGAGTLTVSGANTYDGATTISAGTFFVDGNQSASNGAVTVSNAGTTLGGNGALGGTTALGADTKLTPGRTGIAGNLTFTAGLNLSASSNDTGAYLFDLGAVASSDKVTITTGTLDIGTLDAADFVFTNIGGLTTGVYTLFDSTGATLTGSIGTSGVDLGGGFFGTLSISGEDVLLTVVPEPTALLSLSLAVGLMFWVKRARRLSASV